MGERRIHLVYIVISSSSWSSSSSFIPRLNSQALLNRIWIAHKYKCTVIIIKIILINSSQANSQANSQTNKYIHIKSFRQTKKSDQNVEFIALYIFGRSFTLSGYMLRCTYARCVRTHWMCSHSGKALYLSLLSISNLMY